MNHNQYIFSQQDGKFTLHRQFEEMYRHCSNPHGQAEEMARLDYQLALSVAGRSMSMINSSGPVRVLDVGCGLGIFTARLKMEFPAAHIAGCDVSPTAIAKAGARTPACEFFELDLKQPIPPARIPYDLIVALDVLYYFTEEEVPTVMSNLSALLREHGMILVGYHLPKVMNFGRYIQGLDDARQLFAKYGFAFSFSWDVNNQLDVTYAGEPVGRHIYFLARKT